MAKMGRPRKPGRSLCVRLDPSNAEALETYVEAHKLDAGRTTKNSVINYALREFFKQTGTH